MEGKGSVPLKVKECACLCAAPMLELLPCHPIPRIKLLVQIWGDTSLSQKCPKETCAFPLTSLEEPCSPQLHSKGLLSDPGLLWRGGLELKLGSQGLVEACIFPHKESCSCFSCGDPYASTTLGNCRGA